MQERHEWHNEIEEILHNFANGTLDSIECIHELRSLGYSEREIMEEVAPNAYEERSTFFDRNFTVIQGGLSRVRG
jgi:hypothetical protein